MVRGTTEEERQQIVESFCNICDRYKPDRACGVGHSPFIHNDKKYGSDQERYAMRSYCGWAKVNGRSATIRGDDIEFKYAETVKRSNLEREE